jgi:hypothetical protein
MMNHSESIVNLAIALSSVQAEMPPVPLDGYNSFVNSRYTTHGTMIETAQPLLTKHGLAVAQIVTSEGDSIGIETVLMHTSGEWISGTATMTIGPEKGKSMAQVAGSIITYLRRYSYDAVLGLYTEEDAAPHAGKPKPKQPAAAAKPSAPSAGNGNAQGLPSFDSDMCLCDMEGKDLYAIQKAGPEKLKLSEKAFEARWKELYNVHSLKEIPATMSEFMAAMTPNPEQKPIVSAQTAAPVMGGKIAVEPEPKAEPIEAPKPGMSPEQDDDNSTVQALKRSTPISWIMGAEMLNKELKTKYTGGKLRELVINKKGMKFSDILPVADGWQTAIEIALDAAPVGK